MGRLIDADKMINELGISDRDIYCKCLIEEQPTAFDVEAVVKELEELKGQAFLTLANTDHAVFDFAYNQVLTYLDKVIEIVKGGVK